MGTAVTQSTTALLPPDASGVGIKQADHLSASQWHTAEQVAQRVQLVQQVYRAVMKVDTHYGIIPGCDKPSLWKPGSEQLMMTFRLAATPAVEDLSTADCARYRVSVQLTHAPTGMFLGSGIGECSSDEAKYKWRAAVCAEEYEDMPADRRRIVWKKGNRGPYSITQVRTEPADVANTVLKMAKKRAQIDAVLTVTAASDIFTQDIEDMEHPIDNDENGQTSEQPKSAPVQMPQRRHDPQPPPDAPDPTPQTEPPPPPPQAPPQSRPYSAPSSPSNFRQQAAQQHREAPSQTARTPQGEKISEAQDRRFFAICMGAGITKTEMQQYLKDHWGIATSRDIVKGDMYEECVRWAQGN